jgi:hypothetical protein
LCLHASARTGGVAAPTLTRGAKTMFSVAVNEADIWLVTLVKK